MSVADYLLDTSFIIALWNEPYTSEQTQARLKEIVSILELPESISYIEGVVLSELIRGLTDSAFDKKSTISLYS